MWKLVILVLLAVACTAEAGAGDQDSPATMQAQDGMPIWESYEECETDVIERTLHKDGEPVTLNAGAQYILDFPTEVVSSAGSLRIVPWAVCQRLIRDQLMSPLDRAIRDVEMRKGLERLLRDLNRR